jgi:hypothetical protein
MNTILNKFPDAASFLSQMPVFRLFSAGLPQAAPVLSAAIVL